jgi:hypothetical protein
VSSSNSRHETQPCTYIEPDGRIVVHGEEIELAIEPEDGQLQLSVFAGGRLLGRVMVDSGGVEVIQADEMTGDLVEWSV